MSTTDNKKLSSNDFLIKIMNSNPKISKTIDQIDSESQNTMDYYKEDSSTKNSLIEETKIIKKLPINIEIKKKEDNQKNISLIMNKTDREQHKSINTVRTKTEVNFPRIQNVQKLSYDYSVLVCSICNSDNDLPNKFCFCCKKTYCEKCFKGNYKKNLDNNDNYENYGKNSRNEKLCFQCNNKNINNSKSHHYKKEGNRTFIKSGYEPLDSFSDGNVIIIDKKKSKITAKKQNKEKMKNLEDQYKEFDLLLNQIDQRKKEIKFKKDISLNILQTIQKIIETDFERNIHILNEFSNKLIKIKNDIIEKMNKNNNNEIDLKINIDVSKRMFNSLSKNYENYVQTTSARPIFKGYKLYESNNILINYSETYYMKSKEVTSNFPFGNIYIKIDKFTNNYINYFNFSTIIKPSDKIDEAKDEFQKFFDNKGHFFVYILVNDKILRLNRTNKDNNNMILSYDGSEEENKILLCKCKSNNSNMIKKNNLDVKVVISEIII